MKFLKIFGSIIISILLIIYLLFLFILPNAIDLNNYKPDIYKLVKDLSGLELSVENVQLKTLWNLKIKVILANAKVLYPDKKELFTAKNGSVQVDLIHLVLMKLRINEITLNSPDIKLELLNDNNYDIIKYLNENLKIDTQKNNESSQELPIKLSSKLPNIIIKNYNISLKEQKTSNLLGLKGNELKIYDGVLAKRIKIATTGSFDFQNKPHVNFNLKLESFLPDFTATHEQTENKPIEFTLNPFMTFEKYNFYTDINTDLKITQDKNKEINLNGYLNSENISYKLKGQDVKNGFIKLTFKGNQIGINSKLFINNLENVVLNGFLKTGKKQNIELNLLAKKLRLNDLKAVLVALLDIANIKNDINQLNITGYLDSDLALKSDFKTINSKGYLKIFDTTISHKLLPLKINNVKSNIDFANNKINIKDSSALINGSLFNITGHIDTNANADIKIKAKELPLNLLFEAFAPTETKKTTKISDGKLSMDILIKGALNKITPVINVSVNSLKIKELSTKSNISASSISANIKADTNGAYNGTSKINNLVVFLPEFNAKTTVPLTEFDFDTENIKIKPTTINIDSSKFTLNGTIKDYTTKKLLAELTVNGKLLTTDALKYIPKDSRAMFTNKGSIPIIVKITSNGIKTDITAQALANSQNYIKPLTLTNLLNKTSIANLSVNLNKNTLKIDDIGLYGLYNNKSLSNNFKNNISNSFKVLAISGKIDNINAKAPQLNNIKIITPTTISATIPGFKKSSVTLKSDITVTGNVLTPILKGYISIPTISIADYGLAGKNITVNLNKDILSTKASYFTFGGSQFDFDIYASTAFNKYFTIYEMTVNSPYLDADKLLQLTASMPQNSVSPNASIPLIIKKGKGVVSQFKYGEITASNASYNFDMNNNVFKLKNLLATVFGGTISGNIDYNIPYTNTEVSMTGTNLDANNTVKALAGIKDQVKGTLNFDTNLTLNGLTQRQQMQSLKGKLNFNIKKGQMGSLGKFENFLNAQNLISQRLVRTSINSVINTLSPKNTGKFEYFKGNLSFSNGWATLSAVESSGPQMSMFISGKYNILTNFANLEILGRLSNDVVSVLGPIGNLSISKLIQNIPTIGSTASTILSSYNAVKDTSIINKIPNLTPLSSNTKTFQVLINGTVTSTAAVKSFKWLATQQEVKNANSQISTQLQNLIPPDLTKIFTNPTASSTPTTQKKTLSLPKTQTNTTTTPAPNMETIKQNTTKTIQKSIQNNIKLPDLWNNIAD